LTLRAVLVFHPDRTPRNIDSPRIKLCEGGSMQFVLQ